MALQEVWLVLFSRTRETFSDNFVAVDRAEEPEGQGESAGQAQSTGLEQSKGQGLPEGETKLLFLRFWDALGSPWKPLRVPQRPKLSP